MVGGSGILRLFQVFHAQNCSLSAATLSMLLAHPTDGSVSAYGAFQSWMSLQGGLGRQAGQWPRRSDRDGSVVGIGSLVWLWYCCVLLCSEQQMCSWSRFGSNVLSVMLQFLGARGGYWVKEPCSKSFCYVNIIHLFYKFRMFYIL